MAKHLLQHATFTGAASKKARLLLDQAEVSSIAAAAASAAFFSNSRTTMMKAEPWDAATCDLSNPFSDSNGRRDQPASFHGPVRGDHGIKRRAGSSNRKFTTMAYYDGHEWRKYGEKKISGLDFPRCYYRCTYSPCPAKKKVEQVNRDYPPMYLVTYEKEHTCQVSSRGACSAVAAAAVAPKAEPVSLPFASQVHESATGVQMHTPPSPSTITEVTCQETCSSIDHPALPESGTLESLVNCGELSNAALVYSSPELPILPSFMEPESREIGNCNLPSISPAGDQECPLLNQSDLATLELFNMVAVYDALGMATVDDQQNFLSGQGAPVSFDSSYLDVLGQLEFNEVDSLHPLWSW